MTEYRNLYAGLVDLNGIWRGKRVPGHQREKLEKDGFRMPLTACELDIWGHDYAGNPLIEKHGDGDGMCHPTGRGLLPITWQSQTAALLPVWMFREDGSMFPGDPRCALAAVLERFSAKGLTPVVALEVEFYLLDPTGDAITPPGHLQRTMAGNVLSVDEISDFEGFFADVEEAAEAQEIPADATISELGPGQFEINLLHQPDALRAADDAIFLKQIIKGVARKHGHEASFMAKPMQEASGSGLHIHFSILDESGANIFDNGGPEGTDALRHAVGGLTTTMADATLIFAPHLNSYRRFEPGQHAPNSICWGYENRTVAVRIPGGPNAARRIEHRVAGADANPYLMLAAVLAGALDGMENGTDPGEPLSGNADYIELEQGPSHWREAIERFEQSAFIARAFAPELIHSMVGIKRQEMERFEARMSLFETETYRSSV
ncbi:glutamine synthetase family protein [Paracoccaceae bacterium GXU_MW_L88]